MGDTTCCWCVFSSVKGEGSVDVRPNSVGVVPRGWPPGKTARPRADPNRAVPEPKPYIWLSPAEIRALPIAGEPGCNSRCIAAWTLLRAATVSPARPNLNDLEDETGHFVLAKALVAVRWPIRIRDRSARRSREAA